MYESFYQFKDKPFRLSPDPRFFFQSQGHRRALSYLRYGLSQGEGFIIITGDVGTGKTTLGHMLFDELDTTQVVAGQVVTTQIEADDILRVVAATFGLAHEGVPKGTLLKNLETFFRARTQEGKRVLLLIDEVQNLPGSSLEELRMLSNFEWNGQSLLQCFLLGQEEFRATFQTASMEQLWQRVIAAYHLGPLNAEETRAYIEHRLQTVGWLGKPAFSPEVYQQIFSFTGGVPRRINSLCDRLLWYTYLEESQTVNEKAVLLVVEEIREETMRGDSPKQQRRSAKTDVAVESSTSRMSPELEDRLRRLENSLEELTNSFHQEQKLLRKAMQSSLNLDELETL